MCKRGACWPLFFFTQKQKIGTKARSRKGFQLSSYMNEYQVLQQIIDI